MFFISKMLRKWQNLKIVPDKQEAFRGQPITIVGGQIHSEGGQLETLGVMSFW